MTKIVSIIVIYNQDIQTSSTMQTYLKYQYLFGDIEHDLIIYDNSTKPQDCPVIEGGTIHYIHDARNLGVATAYNYALSYCIENKSKWLLLLDHDTTLTEAYLKEMVTVVGNQIDCIAIVPKIKTNDLLISPVSSETLKPLSVDRPASGLNQGGLMAINSGMLISVAFMESIEGFNMEFPLDYLDHWIFYKINQLQQKVFVLEAILPHELSVMDYNSISLKRYQSILNSEATYYAKYKTDLLSSFKFHLVLRWMKQLVRVKNKKIAHFTFKKMRALKKGE